MAQPLQLSSALKAMDGATPGAVTSQKRIGDFMLKKYLIEFAKDEAGQDIVEYSLLLTLIGATSVFVLTMMGLSVSRLLGGENAFIRGYSNLTVEKSKTH